jgi:hypothetical protein
VSYNHTRNYFDFYGVRYGVGTIVKLKPENYGCGRNIKRCNGIAKFVGGFEDGYIKFSGIVPAGSMYCGIGWIAKPEEKIEKILEPVYYENKPTWQIAMANYQKTPKDRRADIVPGTIFYITAMVVGAIFKGAILIWIIATILYLNYLIDIYRD